MMQIMHMRFCNGPDRAPMDVHVPADAPVPRVGDTILLPTGHADETARWSVKSVVWDYSHGVSVDVTVASIAPARVPSFAAYTD